MTVTQSDVKFKDTLCYWIYYSLLRTKRTKENDISRREHHGRRTSSDLAHSIFVQSVKYSRVMLLTVGNPRTKVGTKVPEYLKKKIR